VVDAGCRVLPRPKAFISVPWTTLKIGGGINCPGWCLALPRVDHPPPKLKDLNHQPRAYAADRCLIRVSIPKTRIIAFSFGRAGLNPLDFSEAAVTTTRPNSQSTSKQQRRSKFRGAFLKPFS
jgi:hypothetical protein